MVRVCIIKLITYIRLDPPPGAAARFCQTFPPYKRHRSWYNPARQMGDGWERGWGGSARGRAEREDGRRRDRTTTGAGERAGRGHRGPTRRGRGGRGGGATTTPADPSACAAPVLPSPGSFPRARGEVQRGHSEKPAETEIRAGMTPSNRL